MKNLNGITLGATLLCSLLPIALAVESPLSPGEPIVLEKTTGKFDFIRIDEPRHRLLLAHTGNKTLDVFDLDSKRLLKSVPTGAAQDSAPDHGHHRYYVSVSAPPRMAIVDAEKLEMVGEVPLPAPADLMTYNAANDRAYVCNDESPQLWVIDGEAKKIESTITLKGKGMEDLVIEPQHRRLFQVVKDANSLVVLDLANNKVLDTWSTEPATNPHGMALVPDTDTLLVAGGSGKLVLLNRSSGKLLSSADIAPRVDEMTYDAERKTAFCGSSQNRISVVKVDGEKLNSLGDVVTPSGAKSIVVDPKTHVVWIAYSKGDQSFVQPFTPGQ